jgi:hypothetical protein
LLRVRVRLRLLVFECLDVDDGAFLDDDDVLAGLGGAGAAGAAGAALTTEVMDDLGAVERLEWWWLWRRSLLSFDSLVSLVSLVASLGLDFELVLDELFDLDEELGAGGGGGGGGRGAEDFLELDEWLFDEDDLDECLSLSLSFSLLSLIFVHLKL